MPLLKFQRVFHSPGLCCGRFFRANTLGLPLLFSVPVIIICLLHLITITLPNSSFPKYEWQQVENDAKEFKKQEKKINHLDTRLMNNLSVGISHLDLRFPKPTSHALHRSSLTTSSSQPLGVLSRVAWKISFKPYIFQSLLQLDGRPWQIG